MKTLITLALALGLITSVAFAQTDESLEDLAGIPVMSGLQEMPLERIVFDKPEGRIIHAALAGAADIDAAVEFYRESLGQLGWGVDGDTAAGGDRVLLFSRDGEILTLTFSPGDQLALAIDLKPEVQGAAQ